MKISKLARREGKQLYRCCLVNGLLDEHRARQAVQEVVTRKPRGYVGVLKQFGRLVKFDLQRRTANVESAVALAPSLASEVQANLTRLYGPGLSITYSQNPALIGGLRVKVGSDVYDGSIQARLASLESTL